MQEEVWKFSEKSEYEQEVAESLGGMWWSKEKETSKCKRDEEEWNSDLRNILLLTALDYPGEKY